MSANTYWTAEEVTPTTRVHARSPSWYDRYRRALVGMDLVMISGVITATYLLKFGDELIVNVGETRVPYVAAGVLMALLLMVALGACESRSRIILGAGLEEYNRVLRACLAALAAAASPAQPNPDAGGGTRLAPFRPAMVE